MALLQEVLLHIKKLAQKVKAEPEQIRSACKTYSAVLCSTAVHQIQQGLDGAVHAPAALSLYIHTSTCPITTEAGALAVQ